MSREHLIHLGHNFFCVDTDASVSGLGEEAVEEGGSAPHPLQRVLTSAAEGKPSGLLADQAAWL
jgi:hypothetical protein